MSEVAISIQDISKSFILFKRPQDRLKESLFKYFGKHYGRVFWALSHVTFDVRKGEVLGIIGQNGSGKSTLLQIIAGILQPTSGKINVNGQLAAMLELGAGFNPEFTGRENIYLNGAILGLSDQEIRDRIDQITDFAGIGEFIDQPVKIYSSGMYVRLAFAIAVSIDPEILIIDEALSVGDAGFVIKCMNYMNQLKEKGTTIILVTHDVQTVRSFCDTAIWLNNGMVEISGTPNDVTSLYVRHLFNDRDDSPFNKNLSFTKRDNEQKPRTVNLEFNADLVRWGSGQIRITSCCMDNGKMQPQPIFEYGDSIHIGLEAQVLTDIYSDIIGVGIALRNSKGLDVITSTTIEQGNFLSGLEVGQIIQVSFDFENILAPGEYALVLNIEDRQKSSPSYLDFIENAIIFKVVARKHIYSLVLPPVQQTIRVTSHN